MNAFPFAPGQPPEHRAALPDAADCVVIGGGIVGVTTALYLRRKGLRVVLVEKGVVAGEQSGRNWGWVRAQGRDPAEIALTLEAQDLWRALDAECGGRLGLARAGTTYLAQSARDVRHYEAWADLARGHGMATKLLTPEGIDALMGDRRRGNWPAALHTADDLRAEPWIAVPEMARLAAAEGVVIAEHCAARGLDMQAGRVAGVVTEAGTIACAQAVLAGGAWSALFLRRHGVSIPQLSVRASVLATGPLPRLIASSVASRRIAIRVRADGGYTLAPTGFREFFIGPDAFGGLRAFAPLLMAGERVSRLWPASPRGYPDAWGTKRRWSLDAATPFEAARMLHPRPHAARLARLRREFQALFPELPDVPVAASWAGMIDVVPDMLPVVDHVASLPGLIVGTAMCGHGFGSGPAYGRMIADMVTGAAPGQDTAPFALHRAYRPDPRGGPAL